MTGYRLKTMAREKPAEPSNYDDDNGDFDAGGLPFQLRIDLIVRELERGLQDCAELRKLDRATKVKAKHRVMLLMATLRNARYYVNELDKTIGFDKD